MFFLDYISPLAVKLGKRTPLYFCGLRHLETLLTLGFVIIARIGLKKRSLREHMIKLGGFFCVVSFCGLCKRTKKVQIQTRVNYTMTVIEAAFGQTTTTANVVKHIELGV